MEVHLEATNTNKCVIKAAGVVLVRGRGRGHGHDPPSPCPVTVLSCAGALPASWKGFMALESRNYDTQTLTHNRREW